MRFTLTVDIDHVEDSGPMSLSDLHTAVTIGSMLRLTADLLMNGETEGALRAPDGTAVAEFELDEA